MASLLDRVLAIAKVKGAEFYSSLLTSAFEADQEPEVRFTSADVQRAGALVRSLRKSAARGDWTTLRKPAGRNALIWAARRLSQDDHVEWAVIGLGTGSERGRSFIKQVYAKRGKEGSVSLPVSLLAEIRGHLESEDGAEFVHIHNHPANVGRLIKNFLVGEEPMASWADRRFHLEYDLFRQDINKKAIRPRQVRCYLIENGDVRRYRLAATPELIVGVVHELERLGLSNIGVAEVVAVMPDLGLHADPGLVEKIVRR